MKIKVHTKVLLVRPDGSILVIKRSLDDDRRPGEWDFPGGGVEAGENPTQGAVGEVAEEAGITIDPATTVLFYAETEAYKPRNDSNTRVMYVAFIDDAQASSVKLSHEHTEFKWEQPQVTVQGFPHPVYGRGLQYALKHQLLIR